jgi:hypothetical protein
MNSRLRYMLPLCLLTGLFSELTAEAQCGPNPPGLPADSDWGPN